MSTQTARGARAQRGARQGAPSASAREVRRQPGETHAAEPPQSGRPAAVVIERASPTPTLCDFNSMRPMRPATLKQALQLQSGATLKRAIGEALIAEDHDLTGGRFALAEAASMDERVMDFLDFTSHVTGPVRPGNGGEMIVATREAMGSIPGVVDTVRESPNMLSAGASRERLELTGNALTLAVDTAESIKPKNSIEKMLAHQLAASHRLGMLFADQSASLVERAKNYTHGNQTMTIEAARLANSAARMMASFQDGMLALDRVRRGGRQTVKVVHQHVAVGPGGQAVVAAGGVKGGGRKGGGRKVRNGR